jgi:hypothetical protein
MKKNEGRRIGGINRDVFVFTFFLLLSFAFWYLNSLSKESEADIRVQFNIVNVPRGKVVAGVASEKINLTLKGPGFSILKLKYQGMQTSLAVDLSKITYRRVSESKDPDYYIVTSGLLKSFKLQLHSGCEVISVKPDTLFFSLNKAEIKPASR